MAGDWRFSKMHGAGNDFIVLDLRNGHPPPTPTQCRQLADRHLGVGCDQILTIEPPRTEKALAAYRIFNADGSPSAQCGNGARCVTAWLIRTGAACARCMLDSPAGTHAVADLGNGLIEVSMGTPIFAPHAIPLRGFETAQSNYTLALVDGATLTIGALSMGNPHAVIEVDSISNAAVETLGPTLQRSAYFPESANIGFAEIIDSSHIYLRVFERGVGETLACGSGACAAAVSLIQRGRISREVAVNMRGGTLHIIWPADDADVIMRGPAVFVFEGEWADE